MFKISQNGEIKLTRGDSAEFEFGVYYENGEKYIIGPNDKVVLSVKKKTSDKNTLIQKTLNENGFFKFEPKDTNGFNFGIYKYDVELTTEKGDVYTVIAPNTFEICEEVTY